MANVSEANAAIKGLDGKDRGGRKLKVSLSSRFVRSSTFYPVRVSQFSLLSEPLAVEWTTEASLQWRLSVAVG
jgi:hypothetical protein